MVGYAFKDSQNAQNEERRAEARRWSPPQETVAGSP